CFGRLLRAAGQAPSRQAAEELLELSEEGWRESLGFPRPPEDLAWVRECLPEDPGGEEGPPPGRDAGDELVAALEAGLPATNILVLLAEAVDKRKSLYKYIDKRGAVLDLAVDAGSSSAARKDQEAVLRELAEKTFAALGKKIEPRALPVLLDRVGFHPVAVVMESEKLALHAGEAATVTLADLDLLVGRTREEALYELTEAVGNRDLAAALVSLARLREGQIHALVIVAGLRNFCKKLLLARALQDRGEPAYSRGMAFPAFQKGYLPQVKESGEWPPLLAGHPFVIYKTFRQAEGFTAAALRQALALLLAAEYRLKSSRLPEPLVLQSLMLQLFLDSDTAF
ncbi:MAG: DNA polymerase III subunit delta, partial [Desulfobacteraceae bacterium]|nr:DNA polymerase III subunit delta [Desulfobacteraceae bacterium]